MSLPASPSEKKAPAPTLPGHCPFCKSPTTKRLFDCFDPGGKMVCELWYCKECKGFFPDHIQVEPPREEEDGAERRRFVRLNVQFVIEVLSPGTTHSKPILATVINASGGGFCFLFPDPIPEGTEVNFRISLPSVPRSFEAKGRIVRCLPAPDSTYGLAVNLTEVDPQYKLALERYVQSQIG